jgi:hypothetical protein
MCKEMFFPFFFPAEGYTKTLPQTTYLVVPEQQPTNLSSKYPTQVPPATETILSALEDRNFLLGRLCAKEIQKQFWQHHPIVLNEFGTLEIKPIQKWTVGLAAAGTINTRSF